MLRWLAVCLALVPLVVLLSGFSETWFSPTDHLGMPTAGATPSPTDYPLLDSLRAHASPQVDAGAATFHLLCATCHGPTGGGLAQARLAFDPLHRECERCHAPGNAPLRKDMPITPHQVFSIGHPPPLRDAKLLRSYPTPSDLFTFIRDKMPRYDPGMLSDTKYVQLVAFLLALNGAMPPGAHLAGPTGDLRVSTTH